MRLLLDTCAALWISNNDPLSEQSRQAINTAATSDGIFISPISAWEVGLLTSKKRITLSMSTESWFDALLELPGICLVPMSPSVLIAASFLPGEPSSDPADRIIVATARAENLRIVTRDRKILDYADAGHVRALEC